jgi:hypothetical protein
MATGVIEGACRHRVKDRMAVAGIRGSQEGAEAVRRLQSRWGSGDVEVLWHFHLAQGHKRNHTTPYADGKVPMVQSQPGSLGKGVPLRLITMTRVRCPKSAAPLVDHFPFSSGRIKDECSADSYY